MDMDKVHLIPVALDISVPFSCDSSQNYIAGRIFQDDDKYWRIKYDDKVLGSKFNESRDAFAELIGMVEFTRSEMLDNEWKKSGI